MGSAMLEGWLALGLGPEKIAVHRAAAHQRDHRAWRGTACASIRSRGAIGDVAAVVVAVKPQSRARGDADAGAFRRQPRPSSSPSWPGARLRFLDEALPGAALVRAMPNTPAAIGRGITVAVANARVSPQQRELVHALLSAVGAVEWVADEALMDAVTALSGSGPAYVFLLAEAMATRRRRGRAAARARRDARARDRRGRGRAAPSLAARCRDAAAERHLARRHHRRRARRADGEGRPRAR